MIARGFKSVIWVAAVGSAALGCYMVSLRVATERNELAKVERQILAAKRDIRSLQTELGTRGRMTQLEQWNAEVLALSAPSSAQFLKDEFTLARLYRNDPTVVERSAEVRLASADSSAPAETAKPSPPPVVQAIAERPAAQPPMVHRASFTTAEATAKAKPASAPVQASGAAAAAKPGKPAAERTASAAAPKPAASSNRSTGKPAAKPSKPSGERGASAAAARLDAASARSTKPAARPETPRTAAIAKAVREAAAAPRATKAKGGGGN
ncbi:MAG TPA: hypothetical protein VGB04_05980 [Allosphingosinicella sp.]